MSANQNKYKSIISIFFKTGFYLSILGILLIVFDLGFPHSIKSHRHLHNYYLIVLLVGASTTILRYLIDSKSFKRSVLLFDGFSILLTFTIIIVHYFGHDAQGSFSFLYHDNWVRFVVALTFIREFSEQNIAYKRTVLNPAQLFILSFLLLIFIGSLLLLLPKATHHEISYIDALFTATSAVCVTGLVVVDTGSYFTTFGQTIILLLIQAGGLGILTIASYFSYFFKGGTTYENQLTLSDITGSDKISEVFSTLKRIIVIALSIELVAAVLIFFTLDNALYSSFIEKAFFSVFHAVSAFCNAGFSTLTNNLYENGFAFNYTLQLIIIFSFVLGGLGFPIVVNILKFLKYYIKNKVSYFFGYKQEFRPWVLTLTSRISLVTTVILIGVGTILFYLSEYNNTLAEHGTYGKVVTALFGATTPRTAGFNTVDTSALNLSTLMLIFLLMWIGASPASTGGGIKTNTFAIAILNFVSLAKGKTRIEVFRREIADISVHRAFATIILSLFVLGLGIALISLFDGEKTLISIAFECFSAYSTVGLSLGITDQLSTYSKLVVIVVMFVGRVSMLTIMIAIIKKVKQQNYRYPTEEITIN